MFAALNLPFEITFWILGAVWLIAAIYLKQAIKILWLSLAIGVLFIPACTGVMLIVDQYRYGRFEYPLASAVPHDGYIELPAAATDITIFKTSAGHRIRCIIATDPLQAWVDDMWQLRPELNAWPDGTKWSQPVGPAGSTVKVETTDQIFARNQFLKRVQLDQADWVYSPEMITTHVRRSDRGGGFCIYHLPATGETYLSATYW